MKNYIKLARPKHWIKNFLIFLPLFCSLSFSKSNLFSVLLGFISFSFMASFIYIINDVRDVDKDRKHSKKKNRPIASGQVSIVSALLFASILLIISFILNYFASGSIFNKTFCCLLAYLLINISYSLGLKNVAIIDIILLASGFILRVYFGAFLIGVPVSNWLFLTVLSASLYLGLGKRQKEFQYNSFSREVLKSYDLKFLNDFMNICMCMIIVFYSLWTIEQNIDYLFLSIPLLIVIFMQYSLYMEKSDEGDPTTIFFQNKILIITTIIYILFMFLVMVICR